MYFLIMDLLTEGASPLELIAEMTVHLTLEKAQKSAQERLPFTHPNLRWKHYPTVSAWEAMIDEGDRCAVIREIGAVDVLGR